MVDDAGFDLVTTSEDVTANSTEAITGLVEGGVNTLQVLLTLRAEGNLAAGLLNEAAGVPDPTSLQPLQERFVAAASRAEKLLAQLPAAVDGGALKDLTEKLIAFGTSDGKHLRSAARGATPDRGRSGLLARPATRSSCVSARRWRNWSDRPEQQRCRGRSAPPRPSAMASSCFSSSPL